MKRGRMQAKDIDEAPILAFLGGIGDRWATHWPGPGMPSIVDAIPELVDVPEKVLRAKLGAMVRRGLILGCDCGCRGDWRLSG